MFFSLVGGGTWDSEFSELVCRLSKRLNQLVKWLNFFLVMYVVKGKVPNN